MKEVYVHTFCYHYYGRRNRKSRLMFPMSYGPFQDEDAAREWIRQSGITRATKLMGTPATENIKISLDQPSIMKNIEHNVVLELRTQQNPML